MNHTFTIAEQADTERVGEYQVALAKLKPACTQCGRSLGKRELDARRCANHDECRLRQIWRTASSSGVRAGAPKLRIESGLDLAGYRKLKRDRDLAVSA